MIFYKFLTLIGLLLLGSCLTTDATNSTSTSTNFNQCGSPLLGSNQPSVYNDCVMDRTMSDKSCCYVNMTAFGMTMSMCMTIDISIATTADIKTIYTKMMNNTSTINDINCGAPPSNSAPGPSSNTCGVASLAGSRPTSPSDCTLDTSNVASSCCYMSLQMSSIDLTMDVCMKYPTVTIQTLKSSNTNLASALNTLLSQYGQAGITVSKFDCESHFVKISFLMFVFLLLLF